MDVLISWSKKQSREMASVFHGWLPKVVPGFKPWMSSKDIDKGKQWFGELQGFLGEATSCIICVTSENVRSPWIYYETGAIAAKRQDVLVCPYLVGIGTSMISDGPFSQWQCTESTKDDTLALIKSLNKAIAAPHDEGLLCGNFESKWPEFEPELKRILAVDPVAASSFVETEADKLAGFNLSSEARKLLVAAAANEGKVLRVGGAILVGSIIMNDQTSHRSIAIWHQALSDLVEHRLMEEHGYTPNRFQTGVAFNLTGNGYKTADALQICPPI